jgi:hypothetical protein
VSTIDPHRPDQHERNQPQVRPRRYEQLSHFQSGSAPLGATYCSQSAPTAPPPVPMSTVMPTTAMGTRFSRVVAVANRAATSSVGVPRRLRLMAQEDRPARDTRAVDCQSV